MENQDPEFEQVLAKIGFSANETKILVELYKNPLPLSADDINKITNVSLPRVYEALDELFRKGFVGIHDGRPRLYFSENPQKAISNFLDDAEKQYQERMIQTKRIAQEVLSYTEEIYLRHNTQIEPDELMQQFASLQEAESKTIQLIQEAEQEILIFTHVFQWYYNIQEYLLEAIERGCKVKIMMQINSLQKTDFPATVRFLDVEQLKAKGMEIRSIPPEGIMTRGTLVDRKAVVYVIWADEDSDKEKPKRRIYRPQYSANPGVAEVFYGYFNYLWQVDR